MCSIDLHKIAHRLNKKEVSALIPQSPTAWTCCMSTCLPALLDRHRNQNSGAVNAEHYCSNGASIVTLFLILIETLFLVDFLLDPFNKFVKHRFLYFRLRCLVFKIATCFCWRKLMAVIFSLFATMQPLRIGAIVFLSLCQQLQCTPVNMSI